MKHNYKVRIITVVMLLALALMAVLPAGALTVGKQDPAMSIVTTLESGAYDGVQTVILKATDGADIYYTTDRTIPTKETGIRYEGSVTVGREDTNSVTYLTAVAEKDDADDGSDAGRGCRSTLCGLTVIPMTAAVLVLVRRRKED